MNYRIIDHTADFGIHVCGKDEKHLFQNAALAMFESMVETGTCHGGVQKQVSVSGSDRPDLMVNWLRELLFQWTGKQKILQSVAVDQLSPVSITAQLTLENYNPDRHIILNEIKAVTYHQIQVVKSGDHWESRIIFDV